MNCLKCNEDIDNLVGYHTLTDKYIICPKCGNKMTVEYDESWDGEEETQHFWVEQYKEV